MHTLIWTWYIQIWNVYIPKKIEFLYPNLKFQITLLTLHIWKFISQTCTTHFPLEYHWTTLLTLHIWKFISKHVLLTFLWNITEPHCWPFIFGSSSLNMYYSLSFGISLNSKAVLCPGDVHNSWAFFLITVTASTILKTWSVTTWCKLVNSQVRAKNSCSSMDSSSRNIVTSVCNGI